MKSSTSKITTSKNFTSKNSTRVFAKTSEAVRASSLRSGGSARNSGGPARSGASAPGVSQLRNASSSNGRSQTKSGKRVLKNAGKNSGRSDTKHARSKRDNGAPSSTPAIIALVALAIIVIGGIIWYFSSQTQSTVTPIVTVNGHSITQEELNFQYNLLPEDYRQAFTKEQVLEQVIDEELVVQASQRQGINVTDEDVNERVQGILSDNQITISELEKSLAERNITVEQFEHLIRRQAMIDRFRDRVLVKNEPEDGVLEGLYNTSLSRYAVPEQVTVRHVLVSLQRNDSAVLAKSIYDAAIAGGNFCDLVLNTTDDRGSRDRCGEYTFARGFMVPEFEQASFDMRDGEIRLVQTQFGYHIIVKVNSTPETIKPFEDVRDEIAESYTAADYSQQYRKLVSGLRDAATLVYENGTTVMPQQAPSMQAAPTTTTAQDVGNDVAAGEDAEDAQTSDDAYTAPSETVPAQETPPVQDSGAVPTAQDDTEAAANAKTSAPSPEASETTPPAQGTPDTATADVAPASNGLFACIASTSTLYGKLWNTDTRDAIDLFKRNGVELKFVDCGAHPSECETISGYPTWSIKGWRYVGRMSLEQLKDASDC